MPIFQDDLGGGDQRSPPTMPPIANSPPGDILLARKLSEESIRTELCDGPLLESPEYAEHSISTAAKSEFMFPAHETSGRELLIEQLKKENSKSWWTNRELGSLFYDCEQDGPPRTPSQAPSCKPSLLPSPELLEPENIPSVDVRQRQAGHEIERPRSALHSGDFTERTSQSTRSQLGSKVGVYPSERQDWLATSPPRNFYPSQLDPTFLPADVLIASRSRAPSLSSSYSSSFVLKPPTSPLVQSETNDDSEFSPLIDPINITPDFKRNPRRHTLQVSHSLHSTTSIPPASSFSKPLPHLRRDNTHPYQAHQPRRSLTPGQMSLFSSSPQTPAFPRSRRPSYASDSSPLHASMVGSYEESILRGRMSTTPSKPLDFVAQIGVLGLGKCKASLRCPAHVTIPFPAVFYSYESTPLDRAGKSEDGPSPYVGQIDLENNLPNPDLARESKRKKLSTNIVRNYMDDLDMIDGPRTNQVSEHEIPWTGKQKRRPTTPRVPPGGCYRIPEKGQLQIIIKNPNKTAVKLFLVPYDLTGMEPGTKTFIRQRSYSAGPIIDSVLSSSPQIPRSGTSSRPTLRYLVHLHICSPSRGRFYLYKSIRVVFANRVPDGKEKLRNEITLPEPRYSLYKPGRDSSLGLGLISGAGASLTAEKAFRRRSSGYTLSSSHRHFDAMERSTQALDRALLGNGPSFPHGLQSNASPIQPIPFSLFHSARDPSQGHQDDIHSPTSSKSSRPTTSLDSEMSWTPSPCIGSYDKLSKGDAGYGGNAFNGSPDGKQAAEGLLAKKLRDMGVRPNNRHDRLGGV